MAGELFDAREARTEQHTAGIQNQPSRLGTEAQQALVRQHVLAQQTHKAERENASALEVGVEGVHSFFYQGAQAPILSLAQMADGASQGRTNIAGWVDVLPAPEEAPFGSGLWWAQQFGGGAGMAIPFMATKGSLKFAGLSFAARTETATLAGSRLLSLPNAGLIADGAISGYAYDSFLRPVDPSQVKDGSQWKTRFLEHGPAGAATFGTLTAGSVLLRHGTRGLAQSLVEGPRTGRVLYDIGMGTLPGIPAGIVNADVSAKLSKGRWATMEERWKGGATMAAAGGMLSAFHSLPGSEVPLGEVASAYQSRRAASNNLAAMLAAREVATARGATAIPVNKSEPILGRDGSSGSASENLTRTGAENLTRTGAENLTRTAGDVEGTRRPQGKGKVEPGKTLAGGDVEGTTAGAKEVDVAVPKHRVEALQRGVQMAFDASDVNCTPQQVGEFFKFARGEGRDLKDVMLQVAKSYGDDPRFLTLVREAYLPPEGVEHRVVEGDVKIKTPSATDGQYERWGQFMQIVRDMPQDVDGYVRFRHDVFRWLNENTDLHDWARQYGEQNRFSKIAGPLDYYFGSSNLGRFMDAAEHPTSQTVAVEPAAERLTSQSVAAEPAAETPIRMDTETPVDQTVANQAVSERPPLQQTERSAFEPEPQVRDVRTDEVDMSRSAFEPEPQRNNTSPFARRPPELRPVDPSKLRVSQYQDINAIMKGFENAPPTRKSLDANRVAERIGEMSTDQFATWLDYVYAKPEGVTADGAMNLRSMHLLQNREVLGRPEVIEAYLRHRGQTIEGREGQPQVTLEQVRQFLAKPPSSGGQPLGDWLGFYVEARTAQVAEGKPDAKPHEVLSAALPRWFVEQVRGKYVTPIKRLGGATEYSDALPPQLKDLLEASRKTEPPTRPEPPQRGRPKQDPNQNDMSIRLQRLNDLLKVPDPELRARLMELGAQDQTAVRNIANKLNPETSAPEHAELLRLVLPGATNINQVKILFDAIHFGSKANRADRASEETRANQQLAMAVAEHLVPQSNPNFERTQQLVNDLLTGKIRDPQPERDGGPGGPGGRGGRANERRANDEGDQQFHRRSDLIPPLTPPVAPPVAPGLHPPGVAGGRWYSTSRSRTVIEESKPSFSERLTEEQTKMAEANKRMMDLAIQMATIAEMNRQAARSAALESAYEPVLRPILSTPSHARPVAPSHAPSYSRPFGRMF